MIFRDCLGPLQSRAPLFCRFLASMSTAKGEVPYPQPRGGGLRSGGGGGGCGRGGGGIETNCEKLRVLSSSSVGKKESHCSA